MANYYTVTMSGNRTLMHVRAKGKALTRSAAVADIEIKRLTTDEVLDLHKRGIAIVDADSGKVCNGDDSANVGGTPLGDDAE